MKTQVAKTRETPVMTPMMASTDRAVSSLTSGNRASGALIMTVTPIVSAMRYKTVQRTLSHFGMIRNSSEKRYASFLRRRRIMRMRSLHESPMLCPILGPGVLISSSSFPCKCARSLGNFRSRPLLQQNSARCYDTRHKPPKHNARLPDNFGQTQFAAKPFESAPDKRCARQTEHPGNPGDGPEQQAARIVCGQLFRAHAYAKLRAGGKIFWQLDAHAAKSGDCLRSLRLQGRAGFTFGEVREEPCLVVGGDTFDALIRNQLLGT